MTQALPPTPTPPFTTNAPLVYESDMVSFEITTGEEKVLAPEMVWVLVKSTKLV